MTNNFYKSLACVLGLFIGGCANHAEFTAVDNITVPLGKELAMKAAEKQLKAADFAIEKYDIEDGYIRTRPLSGAQIFEFWRDDNVGAYNTFEANLHTIRRVVELRFAQLNSGTAINCVAKTYRLRIKKSELASNSQSSGFSIKGRDFAQKLNIPAKQKSWTELGNDQRLSTCILEKIEQKSKLNAKGAL
ncbi:MAG: hypothetical protein ISS77_06685 [Phycisphaerae bacterium]|nr:hypothetical protein [Phycisphaerae bacterium]